MERLTHIAVDKLFGYLDQRIQLAVDAGITILHGANGSGKTTILRAIHELSHRMPLQLSQVPFREFRLSYQSGLQLVVQNDEPDTCRIFREPSEGAEPWTFAKKNLERVLLKMRRRGPRSKHEMAYFHFLREMEEIPPNEWLELAQAMPAEFPIETPDAPEWVKAFWNSVDCTLIEEQRLLRLNPFKHRPIPRIRRAVSDYSDRLKELIAESLRQYGEKSQQLDRSFPQRMVRSFADPAPSISSITERYGRLEELRHSLRRASLVEPTSTMLPIEEAGLQDEHMRKVLSLYADDMEAKLSLFLDLHRRITLFLTLINGYFIHKSAQITRDGIHFETGAGDLVDPSSLSSGEQHILVLFFSLIFDAPAGPHLVLIDEPELSLHPKWQLRLVDDLVRIREISQTDFLLASHSPQIFQGHWEMARDLQI